jgi:hypothetical protein
MQAFEKIAYSPVTVALDKKLGLEDIPDFRLETLPAYVQQTSSPDMAPGPFSAFSYQRRGIRMPYTDNILHKEFRTWIYGFVWEVRWRPCHSNCPHDSRRIRP